MTTEQIDLFLATFYTRYMEGLNNDDSPTIERVDEILAESFSEVFGDKPMPIELSLLDVKAGLYGKHYLKIVRGKLNAMLKLDGVIEELSSSKNIKQSLSTLISYQKELDDTLSEIGSQAEYLIAGNNHKTTISNYMTVFKDKDTIVYEINIRVASPQQIIKELRAMAETLEIDLENGLFRDFRRENEK